MKRWLVAFATLTAPFVFSRSAFAVVDARTSNYAETFLHADFSGTGFPLKVQAHYNSRSIYIGGFGFGWCPDFETKIEKLPEGSLRLVECGAGQETIYTSGKVDKSLDAATDQIMAKYKKEYASFSAESYGQTRQRLVDDAEFRGRLAAKYAIPIPDAKKGVVYKAETLSVEQIVFDGANFVRTLSDGTSQKFDAQGHLEYQYDKNSNYLKIVWKDDLIREVQDNSGRKLVYAYYPNKRVKDISGPGGVKLEYKYKGEDLVEWKNMWKNTYKLEYDGGHNLTKVEYPDGTFKKITYNEKLDLVTSFQDRFQKGETPCVESYQYEVDKQNPRDHFWAIATKKCGTEVKNQARFEFWHKTRADNKTKYLHRVLTKSFNDTLDVIYHPEFGRPVSIKKNGITTTFAYYPNGLVREKSTSASKLSFEYKNQHNKVSRVAAEFLDQKGKVVRKRETTFEYDNKANLIYAKNSDGQTVKLAYDARGRIATITDQAKKEVMIKYDEKIGKPAMITRPKLGSITVTYKASGEINKVESKDGPSVAVQVASTFNNLLDIIAPATSELSL